MQLEALSVWSSELIVHPVSLMEVDRGIIYFFAVTYNVFPLIKIICSFIHCIDYLMEFNRKATHSVIGGRDGTGRIVISIG